MPKACRYAMMKSQRLKHFFGRLLCECLHFFGGLFYLGISWGKKCFVFVGEFLGGFYNFVGGIFLRNLIFL